MSLLMDALKKAEQEKKEAAKRQRETEHPSLEGSENKPLEDSGQHEIESEGVQIKPGGIESAAENTGLFSTTADLELEPLTVKDETHEMPTNMDSTASTEMESEDPTLNVTMNTLSLADLPAGDIEIDDADIPDLVNSSITELQSDDSAQLDETFHGVSMVENSELF